MGSVVPLQTISDSVDISEVPWVVILLWTDEFLSEDHKKLLQGLVSHELTAYLSVF